MQAPTTNQRRRPDTPRARRPVEVADMPPETYEEAPTPPERGARAFITALAAGLCWTGALVLLLLANLHTEADPLAPQRLLFYTLVLAATLLTFIPIERALNLPRLAFEGVTSTALLLYVLAFVPPPTGWLLWLPDLPVYGLFTLAIFGSTAAFALPFVYAIGQRVLTQRARRRDVRRARRQSYLIGTLAACTALLAALQALTWVSMLLLLLILVTAELLFLARIEVRRQR